MSHSLEPWRVGTADYLGEDLRRVEDANGVSVLADCSCEKDDAARIVACVNFCRGIPTKFICGHVASLIRTSGTFTVKDGAILIAVTAAPESIKT